MKIVSVVKFQEVPRTFMVSAVVRSHFGIFWRSSEEFEAHSRRFIDADWKRVLASLYSSSACVDVSTSVIMLSTYRLSAIWGAMGVPALVR